MQCLSWQMTTKACCIGWCVLVSTTPTSFWTKMDLIDPRLFKKLHADVAKARNEKKANTMAIKRKTEQHMNASLASSSSKSTKRKQSISSKSSSFPSSKKLLCFSYQASQQATEEGYVRRRQWWPLLSCFFLPRVTSRETKSCFCRCCITRNIEGNEKEK